jgi:Tetratricopeptide repeat
VLQALGPSHPDTLRIRNNIAGWTAECGNLARPLHLAEALLLDRIRVLGPSHPDTLRTRNNIATWTRRVEDAAGGDR